MGKMVVVVRVLCISDPYQEQYLSYDDERSEFSDLYKVQRTIEGGAKGGLQWSVCKTESTLVLLFINYYIISHTNNCKPTFTPCYVMVYGIKNKGIKQSCPQQKLYNHLSKVQTTIYLISNWPENMQKRKNKQ